MDESNQENISRSPNSPIPDSPIPDSPVPDSPVPDSHSDEAAAPSDDDWTIEEIIAELEREFDGTLPEEAIREAQYRRDEIVPHLIKLVERATALVRDGEFPDSNGPLIAVFLLTEFRAKEALPAIVASLSLSWTDVEELYGDAVTEDFCRVFAVLADAPEQLDSLIANRSLGELGRWEAAEAYALWVRDGRLTREQAVAKLRQHLQEAIVNRDDLLAGPLVAELETYVPREAMEEIREAFRLGLVDESIIDLEAVNETLDEGDVRWQEAMENCPPTQIEDTVEELQDWLRYQDGGDDDFDEADFPEDDEDDEYEEDFSRVFREKMGLPPSLLDDPSTLNDDEFRKVWNAAKSQEFPDAHSGTDSQTIRRTEPRVGRNEPCPCGSGKKFKKCCGKH